MQVDKTEKMNERTIVFQLKSVLEISRRHEP